MEYIIFNPEYVLKPDLDRVLLLTKDPLRTTQTYVESVLHPIHAQILSFFTGKLNKQDAINQAAHFLKVEERDIRTFVEKIIDNEKNVVVDYDEPKILVFPEKTLISSTYPVDREMYDPTQFSAKGFRFKVDRHLTPSRITFMATTQCYTDCIYCYANRRRDIQQLDFERVKQMILECKKLHVVSFDVIGGEFFLYKHWRRMLPLLYESGYDPYISTKVPITEDDIKYLKSIGMRDIQVSLDSLIPKNISTLLRAKGNYVERIKQTLYLLDKYEIKIQIHTILTCKNDQIQDMDSIYQFIANLGSVITWKIDFAASTLYKGEKEYARIKIGRSNLKKYIYTLRI
ncbi:MAG: radical SAM protein [Bacteroides sp.]|nr:radical SAM protein [Bacteroides sp.]